MRLRKYVVMLATALATSGLLIVSGSAAAVFPNFSDCPRATSLLCVDVQNTTGTIEIKGFRVPVGESLEIRGGLGNELVFVPPAGSTGLFARPIPVPGGLLGIEFPIPGNAVLATAELAGEPTAIRLNAFTGEIRLPIKLRLSNPLFAPECHIGTNRNPVLLNLITGTTSPPPPNTPISGHLGTLSTEGRTSILTGNLNVDNSFAIPGATECGLLGLINVLVNAKLKLPSAAGNNSMQVNNNVAIQPAN